MVVLVELQVQQETLRQSWEAMWEGGSIPKLEGQRAEAGYWRLSGGIPDH